MAREIKSKNGMEFRKYNNSMSYDCKCGGDFMFDGQGKTEMPIGFGFVGKVFGVTKVIYKGWIGECMKCHKVINAYTSRTVKHIPISI